MKRSSPATIMDITRIQYVNRTILTKLECLRGITESSMKWIYFMAVVVLIHWKSLVEMALIYDLAVVEAGDVPYTYQSAQYSDTVFPQNLTVARFFKALVRRQFEGGVYQDRHARAYTALIISPFVCT